MSSFFFNLRFVLVTHIVNFYLDQATIFETFLHNKSWIFCMDVDFDNFIIVDNEERVSKLVQVVTEFVVVKIFGIGWTLLKGYHDFSTVTKRDILSRYVTSYRLMMFSIDHFTHVGRSGYKVLRCNIFASKG